MKKYLLGIIIFIASTVLSNSATPFEFFNYLDTARGTINDDELFAYAQLRNKTDKEIQFNLKMEFLEITMGHEAAVCWELCYDYTDLAFVSPETYTIGPNGFSVPGQFTAHLHPYRRISIDPLLYTDPVPGKTIVKFTFTPVGAPRDAAEFIVTFIVTDPTNAVDEDINFSINSIYPNPAGNFITLDLGNGYDFNSTAKIYDIKGNAVKTVDINAKKKYEVVNVTDLSNGTYFLNIRNDKKLVTKKFTISR